VGAVTLTGPVVSVVVPTYNRAELLEPLAEALASQHGVESFEVLFVDDCSPDATPEVLRAVAEGNWPAHVTFRPLRNAHNTGNPARARNIGWRAARAPLIAFIDDDCTPGPGWLAGLVRGLTDADIAQGLVEVDQAEALRMGPFGRIIVITEFSWKFETCNIAYQRDLLERVGGFDETFPGNFGEDTDLGLRAIDHGARAAWVPDALVLHRVEYSPSRLRDWLGALRYARRCELAPLLVRRHPAFRDHLFARCFYKPYHASTLALFAGAALARRQPAAVVLAAPWLYRRLGADRPQTRNRWLWAVLPMALVVDAVEVGATVKGAVRFRTFLL
jgi:glycosyltransferase involved in cell wall biosynthesis